ncbi:MAG: flagellar biosynthetic protein FlhB, partial [Clostridia bacterium]|nr:flagellar biosynthetic protein FlhB [Clostridia bacterium]
MYEFDFIINLQLFAEEKTEPATAKRRRESREKGQVAKSKEITTAVLLLVTFITIRMFASSIFTNMTELLQMFFTFPIKTDDAINIGDIINIYTRCLWVFAKTMAPILVISALVAVVLNYLQIGFLFTLKPLVPQFSKLNPIEGFKNIITKNAIVELVKSLLKIG